MVLLFTNGMIRGYAYETVTWTWFPGVLSGVVEHDVQVAGFDVLLVHHFVVVVTLEE
jgi:hypothetical protein